MGSLSDLTEKAIKILRKMNTMLVVFLCAGCILVVTGLSKKGVTIDTKEYQCNDTFVLSNVSWWYDWAMSDKVHHDKGCPGSPRGDFFPMVWGYNNLNISFSPESTNILGFNEPNHADQSYMTPGQAALYWPKVEAAAKKRVLLSPAPARCNSVGGLCTYTTFDWLDQFFNACKGCRVDYMAVHSYTCDVGSDMGFLESVYKRYNRKVWLTEFACPGKPSLKTVQDYMKAILPRLESADFVAGYAWFTNRIKTDGYINTANSLLGSNSSTLTDLGKLYNSLV